MNCLKLEDNGNLVLLGKENLPAWQSNTGKKKVDSLRLQNDGNLVQLNAKAVARRRQEDLNMASLELSACPYTENRQET